MLKHKTYSIQFIYGGDLMEKLKMYSKGKRLYFLKLDGIVILDKGDRVGTSPIEDDFEFDYDNQPELHAYTSDEIDYIDLEHNQYAKEFSESSYFKINTQTKEVQFFYLENNSTIQKPSLEDRVRELENALLLQYDNDFGGIL